MFLSEFGKQRHNCDIVCGIFLVWQYNYYKCGNARQDNTSMTLQVWQYKYDNIQCDNIHMAIQVWQYKCDNPSMIIYSVTIYVWQYNSWAN